MKIYNKIISALSICLVATSCGDLASDPTGELSSANAFLTSSELEKYCNTYYETAFKSHVTYTGTSGIFWGDNKSDNMSLSTINTRLAGGFSLSSASELSEYEYIRGINFLINNFGNCTETGTDVDHYWGEAHYFRAHYYFEMFKDYGPLAWVTEVLDADLEECTLPRDSRTTIVDNILADLDIAIEYMYEQDDNTSRRLHKDVARAYKAEIALFEGTWEKYHKGTDFADPSITDAKINEYLQIAADAAKSVIDRGVWSLYTGDGDNSYNKLFTFTDHSTNPEVLMWKKYSFTDGVVHGLGLYIRDGGGETGASKSLIDDYLTIDGRPFVGTERDETKKVYAAELSSSIRDPRLEQTIATPGQQLYIDEYAGPIYFSYPPIHFTSYDKNTTGYSIRKHMDWSIIDYTGTGYSTETAAIQFRYGQILLMYAEALAEMDGAGNEAAIISAIQPLRDRAGMPPMDFDREYNTEADYGFKNLDKYIQAVRRERRVELAIEDFRFYDIMRWAAADELIVGQHTLGALYEDTDLEEYFEGEDGEDPDVRTKVIIDENGYIQPFSLATYTNGWAFDLNRDYLLPLEPRMVSLTNGLWEQNPGW